MPVEPEDVGDLVVVDEHGRGAVRQDRLGEARHGHHRRLDVHVGVDEPGHEERARRRRARASAARACGRRRRTSRSRPDLTATSTPSSTSRVWTLTRRPPVMSRSAGSRPMQTSESVRVRLESEGRPWIMRGSFASLSTVSERRPCRRRRHPRPRPRVLRTARLGGRASRPSPHADEASPPRARRPRAPRDGRLPDRPATRRAPSLLERAHHDYLGRGAVRPAARCAFWLAFFLLAWRRARARRGVAGARPAAARRRQPRLRRAGLPALAGGDAALVAGRRRRRATPSSAEAAEIGERFGDGDLSTLARHGAGPGADPPGRRRRAAMAPARRGDGRGDGRRGLADRRRATSTAA